MAALDEIYPRKLDFGRVAERTVWVLGRQPLLIFGLALALHGLFNALTLYRLGHLMLLDEGPSAFLHSPFFWGHSLISMLLAAFVEAAVLAVALGELGGRRASLQDALMAGVKFALPLFAVNLLALLGICGGLILLVVPGIMFALAWLVAGPALVVERSGITAVFGRSAELTRNNRWRLLGLALIYAVANSIVQNAAGLNHFHAPFEAMDLAFSPVRIVIGAILGSLVQAAALTALAVIYVELRALKEGEPPADLERVFE